jgi:hypothetical protein
MTAEIAIINRSAVTLATDSAVTLTVRGTEKIYNSADKLFELSDQDPMGIMVYNNLEYMGISLEVAIKQFRGKAGHFKNVADAAEAFFEYLLKDLAPDDSLQKQHAKALLYPTFVDIRDAFHRTATSEIERTKNARKVDFPTVFTRTVQRQVLILENAEVAKCFSDTTEEALADFYSETLEALVADVFEDLPLEDEQKILLKRVGVLFLHRNSISDFFTGLVFAGFGEDETFPSLIAYKTDGVIFGRLKKEETDRVTTNRSEVAGQILPFAQREMVDRFLYGIDPEFERAIEQYLQAAIDKTGETIAKALPKRQARETREKLLKSIGSASKAAVSVWRDKMVPLHKGRFMREVQNMLFLMPKQELAALAQELINLTSVKRKFSSGRESVGGPIDVAVISRIDGGVWVRRKHYFEQSLNPRYFYRKFGAVRD